MLTCPPEPGPDPVVMVLLGRYLTHAQAGRYRDAGEPRRALAALGVEVAYRRPPLGGADAGVPSPAGPGPATGRAALAGVRS